MPDDNPVSPVKLEVSAKAALEIKGEIPPGVMNRLGHAIADFVSPFTEKQGLKGDILRLQRTEVAARIVSDAQRKIEASGAEVRPIPLRTLIPMLERASYEDSESEMCKWWTALLATTSIDAALHQPIFSDLSSKMTADEVHYLDRTLKTVGAGELSSEPPPLLGIFEWEVSAKCKAAIDNHNENSNFLSGKGDVEAYREEMKELIHTFIDIATKKGYMIESLKFSAAHIYYGSDLDKPPPGGLRSERYILDVLISIGVLRRRNYSLTPPTPFIGEFSCYVDALSLTSLGRDLMKVCGAL